MRSYLLASLALGVLATWASENLFWSAPPAGWTLLDFAFTVVAYVLCAAAALSLVLLTGAQGWRAAFLGGAVLGWLVEGVVVGTMYEAFPFQVIWTPLAWHAVVTGLLVVGIGRAACRWSLPRVLGAWLAVGLLAGVWAAYWPIERDDLPGLVPVAGYLLGLGLLVPLAHLALDRVGRVPVPPRAMLLAAPVLLALGWVARVVLAPSVVHLVLPLLLLATWWVLRRSGEQHGTGLRLGAGTAPARHALFLVVPVVASLMAVATWTLAPAGVEVEIMIALLLCLAGLVIYGTTVVTAARRHPPISRDPSSPAS